MRQFYEKNAFLLGDVSPYAAMGDILCRDVQSARLYTKYHAHTPLPPLRGLMPPQRPQRIRILSV